MMIDRWVSLFPQIMDAAGIKVEPYQLAGVVDPAGWKVTAEDGTTIYLRLTRTAGPGGNPQKHEVEPADWVLPKEKVRGSQ